MSENLNKFLEIVSKDAKLFEKVRTADLETLISIAKEVGIVLTEADFAPSSSEISDAELEVVAGGADCYCAVGGGGTGDDNDKTCACVVSGGGETKNSLDGYKKTGTRCCCVLGGWGGDT